MLIFASREPVTRAMLAKVVGPDCNLDLIIDDIQAELRGRPYELVAVAGGWQHRTRKQFADTIRTATGAGEPGSALSASEMQVLLVETGSFSEAASLMLMRHRLFRNLAGEAPTCQAWDTQDVVRLKEPVDSGASALRAAAALGRPIT
jgi:hypothetical protein